MALTFTELNAITKAYFKADNRKAVDIYFNSSFLLDRLMNKKKGLFDRPAGGENIRIGLRYDGAEAGFYSRNSTLSSNDRQNINAAYYDWKHAYSNATLYRTDEMKNAGEYAEVSLVTEKIESAQESLTKILATQLYASAADGAEEINGLGSVCLGADTVAYGHIVPNDLVSADLTTPWAAVNTTDAAGISLAVIRTLASSAKVNDGAKGKPNLGVMPEALFNQVSAILQTQQRFTEDKDTCNAGFTNVVFEGKILAADDYCPTGHLYLLNENHIGFAIHKDGFMTRTAWGDLLVTGLAAKSMKIFWDGNIICSRRKAQAAQTGLT
jgi:hypothetical protein